ncbi:MAG: aminotransferase class V-fold PLP-dependent enzyme [Myxococcota bacterium]
MSQNSRVARAAHHAPIRGEPTAPPIPQTKAWAFRTVQEAEEQFSHGATELYARLGTPLHAAVEQSVAELEGAEAGVLCSTGMAAISCALDSLCPPGSTLVAGNDLYGTTDHYLGTIIRERGVRVLRVDLNDDVAFENALREQPALVLTETLTNPTLTVVPLDRVAERAHRAGAKVLVDATFTPPTMLQSAKLGADYVMHSASKMLAGHGDVLAGVVVGPKDGIARMRSRRTVMGCHLGAMEAWLLARGMRTLHLRAQRASENALFVAHRLESRRQRGKLAQVARVIHPSLPGHPRAEWLSRTTHGDMGNLLCVDLAGGGTAAERFVAALKEIRFVTSLGELCTTVNVPARTSHKVVPADERARRGITDGLIRISVGVEDAADLADELEGAIRACA